MRRSFFNVFSLTSTLVLASGLVSSAAHADEPTRPADPGSTTPPSSARATERASALLPTPPTTPTTPTPPSPPSPSPAPAAAANEPTVLVELHANDGKATLERRTSTQAFTGLGLPDLGIGGVTEWETACVAPCTAAVSPRYTYRVAGEGLVPSSTFALPRGNTRLRLDADLGSSRGRVSGALLTLAGAGALALGAGGLIASPILSANDLGSQGFRTGVLAGGIASVSIGAVLAAVGLTLWLTNDSTLRFEPNPSTTTAAAPRPMKLRWLADGFSF